MNYGQVNIPDEESRRLYELKRNEMEGDDRHKTMHEAGAGIVVGSLGAPPLQAKQLGIGRSTLHYLRREVESEEPFRVYSGAREKLANLGGAS